MNNSIHTPTTLPHASLFRSGGVPVDVATSDSCLVVIEGGDYLGFLLADSCTPGTMNQQFLLEDVVWARCTAKQGFWERMMGSHPLRHRATDTVTLYQHDSGLYVAQDPSTNLLFPNPNIEPYTIIFLSQDQYQDLRTQAEYERANDFMYLIKGELTRIPGFLDNGESLVTPYSYRSGGVIPGAGLARM
ncbi:MAG: hypothetical protein JNJ94_13255 [Chlorobi bacterium]|jgi:hypothetical protein|nr:hypothetical protein [Chlorobiota bacterium]